MNDRKIIYLDDAIDAVCMEWCNVKHQDCKHPFDDEKDDYYWCDGCETVLRTLPDLPSAQSEWKKGKWVYAEDEYGIDGYHCDQCGFFVPWDYTHRFINYIEEYHFCPNCNADMRGEKNV